MILVQYGAFGFESETNVHNLHMNSAGPRVALLKGSELLAADICSNVVQQICQHELHSLMTPEWCHWQQRSLSIRKGVTMNHIGTLTNLTIWSKYNY